jgi:hypothetical protein
MKRILFTHRAVDLNRRHRRALSSLEVIVALTVLLSALSISVSLIVRHGRLLITQRHYRQALDELSNQMDRLTTLPSEEIEPALKQVSVSPFAAARLSAAKLSADAKPADIGKRLTLRLTWKEGHEHSVAMTGWLMPRTKGQAAGNGGEP